MHRLYCPLGVVLVLVCMAGDIYGHNGDHTAYAIPLRDITLDGKLDDWPARMAVYPIDWVSPAYYKGEPPTGPEDISASFRVGYDEARNVLYVALVAYDESLVINPVAGSYHNQDLCELYIDADHSASAASVNCDYGKKALKYVMVAGPSLYDAKFVDRNPALVARNPEVSGVEAAFLRWGNYSVYEWAVPLWTSFPEQRYQIKAGATVGFDIAINDTDTFSGESLSRWHAGNWITWTPARSQKTTNLNRWGDLQFVSSYAGLGIAPEPVLPSDYTTMATVSGYVLRNNTDVNWRRSFCSGMLDLDHLWPNVLVHLRTAAGDSVATVRSGFRGDYRFVTVAGAYQLVVEQAASEAIKVELAAGENRDVDLRPVLSSVYGRVSGPTYESRMGIMVGLTALRDRTIRQTVYTDSSGAYRFWAAPGRYELSIGSGKNLPLHVLELSPDQEKWVNLSEAHNDGINEEVKTLGLVLLAIGAVLLGLANLFII